jgi:ERCC4-type nuclease
LIDTREQRPYSLPNSRVATLKTGDYSVEGFETVIAVERKSHLDLVGCVGQSRERFIRELQRLAEFPYPAIVVEATLEGILAGAEYSQVDPHAAIGSLISWSVRYRVPVWLVGDRRMGAATVRKILLTAVKEIEGKAT